MNTDHRAILSLLAQGRITSREAERLLALAPGGEESLLRLSLCLVFAWLALPQITGLISETAHAFLRLSPAVFAAVHRALACALASGFGGLS
jgi:hypothetical protein